MKSKVRVLVTLARLVAIFLTSASGAHRAPAVAGHQHGIGMVSMGTTDPGWPIRNSSPS